MKPRVLRSRSPEFKKFLAALLDRRGGDSANIDRSVATIIEDVRKRGDRALIAMTQKFDRVKLKASTLQVTRAERRAALNKIPAADRKTLELAARRIAEFHRRTMEKSFSYRDPTGMRLGQMVLPLSRVGIYVPGGLGAYPSSVLMNAIPAKVAGVAEVVMVSPPSREGERLAVLAAAAIAGVDEFFRIGGAQAVAALAYGTESIRPVDKIVGPGNAYVQAAKRMVYGVTDIDKMAGPSEVLVIADDSARPDWIAADLIAQAEHGSGDEAAVLLTPSASIAQEVADAIERALESLPRARQVETALSKRGAMVIVKDLNEAFDLANEIAPEHLELEIRNPSRWLPRVKAAGAVFLGGLSPAPLGDYLAGPNHVLPTGGAARFASPLGAYDFLKRTSIIEASSGALKALGPAVAHLARMEGFEGHARAIEIRNGASKRARGARRTGEHRNAKEA
ncbi:MAG: histidinol dehydrogenase [Candidatus Binatus sp.]|uniref:histidinol dehydrogenase n=1 Tax=Candidatus Binatus sp. TaxID=2811406 RepID=UPI0027180F87|nr:histidinol dehydrogenase [Candidatus Binatus sp.]MDO8434218.1 histidinol dehydrogenase [Candidatus Binatus sp.]